VYDLSRVEESVTKSTYKLGVGFERCENNDERSALKFVLSSNYHKEEETLKPTKTNYPSNPKPSFIVVIVFRVCLVFLLESHTHFEPRHLDGPYFFRHGSRPTRSSDV
jgi:hypothetical protein